jgi:hypothetical protein
MKRVVGWSLAVLGAGLAVATILFPAKVLVPPLFALYWVSTLFHNTKPPPIAEGIVLVSDPTRFAEVSARLSSVLQQKFPAGTSEAVLKSTLQRQGFKPIPPPPADCVRPGVTPPIGRVFVQCYDATNQLRYEWGDGLVCGATVAVAWTTDGKGGVASVRGSYYSACL